MLMFEVFLLSAAAVSTVMILFGVVILGDIQDHPQHAHQRRTAKH